MSRAFKENDYFEDEEDSYADYSGDDEYSDYDNEYGYDDSSISLEERRDAIVQTQCKWIRNEFGHGVFVGKIPKAAIAVSV